MRALVNSKTESWDVWTLASLVVRHNQICHSIKLNCSAPGPWELGCLGRIRMHEVLCSACTEYMHVDPHLSVFQIRTQLTQVDLKRVGSQRLPACALGERARETFWHSTSRTGDLPKWKRKACQREAPNSKPGSWAVVGKGGWLKIRGDGGLMMINVGCLSASLQNLPLGTTYRVVVSHSSSQQARQPVCMSACPPSQTAAPRPASARSRWVTATVPRPHEPEGCRRCGSGQLPAARQKQRCGIVTGEGRPLSGPSRIV